MWLTKKIREQKTNSEPIDTVSERGHGMKKIVLVTDDLEKFENVIGYLGFLFPDCEIQFLSPQISCFGNHPISPEPAGTDKDDKKDWHRF